MERKVGTISRGLRAPIIKDGDDLAQIVIDTVWALLKQANLLFRTRISLL